MGLGWMPLPFRALGLNWGANRVIAVPAQLLWDRMILGGLLYDAEKDALSNDPHTPKPVE